MRVYSVVIVAGNYENAVLACRSLLTMHHQLPASRVIVMAGFPAPLPPDLAGVRVIPQQRPFQITRCWNDALAAVPSGNDVVLVNSDVRFVQGGTLDILARVAYEESGRALLSPAVEGHRWGDDRLAPDSKVTRRPLRDMFFGFVCPYLTVEVRKEVGAFDERFLGYGCDDVDYAVRARRAGFPIVVVPAARILHAHGRSEWRDLGRIDRALQRQSTVYFVAKWGVGTHDPNLWAQPENYPPREVP